MESSGEEAGEEEEEEKAEEVSFACVMTCSLQQIQCVLVYEFGGVRLFVFSFSATVTSEFPNV